MRWVLLCWPAVISPGFLGRAGERGFFRLHWADKTAQMNNTTTFFRVNDEDLRPARKLWKNGRKLKVTAWCWSNCRKILFQLQRTELYMELWGGHPGTEEKRFTPNGKTIYPIPRIEHTAANHCTYTYPSIPVQV